MGCASRRLGRSPSSLWLHCWRKLSTIFTTESPFLLCSNRLLVRSHVRDEYGAYFRSISRLGSREVTYICLKRTSSRIFQCKHNITSSQQFKSTAFLIVVYWYGAPICCSKYIDRSCYCKTSIKLRFSKPFHRRSFLARFLS